MHAWRQRTRAHGRDGSRSRGRARAAPTGGAAVAAVAAIAMALGVGHGLRVTAGLLSRSSVRQANEAQARDQCIYREIRRDIPTGATFYASTASLLYAQRLAGLATLWAVPRPTPQSAAWLITVVPGHCAGIRLKARRT